MCLNRCISSYLIQRTSFGFFFFFSLILYIILSLSNSSPHSFYFFSFSWDEQSNTMVFPFSITPAKTWEWSIYRLLPYLCLNSFTLKFSGMFFKKWLRVETGEHCFCGSLFFYQKWWISVIAFLFFFPFLIKKIAYPLLFFRERHNYESLSTELWMHGMNDTEFRLNFSVP